MRSTQEVNLNDIIETTQRTRLKLSKIGIALIKHIKAYDDVVYSPTSAPLSTDKNIPRVEDL